jgi:hypothetical protein
MHARWVWNEHEGRIELLLWIGNQANKRQRLHQLKQVYQGFTKEI